MTLHLFVMYTAAVLLLASTFEQDLQNRLFTLPKSEGWNSGLCVDLAQVTRQERPTPTPAEA